MVGGIAATEPPSPARGSGGHPVSSDARLALPRPPPPLPPPPAATPASAAAAAAAAAAASLTSNLGRSHELFGAGVAATCVAGDGARCGSWWPQSGCLVAGFVNVVVCEACANDIRHGCHLAGRLRHTRLTFADVQRVSDCQARAKVNLRRDSVLAIRRQSELHLYRRAARRNGQLFK